MWVFLAFAAAFSKACQQALSKSAHADHKSFTIAAIGQILFALFSLSLLVVYPIEVPRNPDFYTFAAITISINILALVLTTYAVRISDLSLSLPFMTFTPVFILVIAPTVLGHQEIPSGLGLGGFALVMLGALLVGADSFKALFQGEAFRIFTNKGVQIILVVSFLYAISSVYDKAAVQAADPQTFIVLSGLSRGLFFAIALAIWTIYTWKTARNTLFSNTGHKDWALFGVLGLMFFIETAAQMYALQSGMVAYVLAIKRTSIVLTTLFGVLFFKEVLSSTRMLGTVVMMSGAALIYATS